MSTESAPVLSKDQFFEQKEKEFKKQNPKEDALKRRKKIEGHWKNYQQEIERKQKLEKKKAKQPKH